MGNTNSGVLVHPLIDFLKPDLVIMFGLCGGISNQGVKIADVVVSDEIFYYELGKKKGGNLEIRPERLVVLPKYVRQIKSLLGEMSGDYSVHVGKIGAGEKVISDPGFLEGLLEKEPKLLAVEWNLSEFLLRQ